LAAGPLIFDIVNNVENLYSIGAIGIIWKETNEQARERGYLSMTGFACRVADVAEIDEACDYIR